jgi:hypothetical protein
VKAVRAIRSREHAEAGRTGYALPKGTQGDNAGKRDQRKNKGVFGEPLAGLAAVVSGRAGCSSPNPSHQGHVQLLAGREFLA